MPLVLPANPGSVPMGANVAADKSGVTFRCRAPRATHVWVVGDFNGWTPDDASLLNRVGEDWIGFVPQLGEGAQYKFHVQGALPDRRMKRDPYARELTITPAHPWSNCIVHDPSAYPWADGPFRPPAYNDLIIYQLHIGTFNGADRENRPCKFLDVLGKLDYLVGLGVNAVLLLPIVEFSSERSLGYEGADIFSPEQDYCVAPAEVPDYLPLVNDLRIRAGLPRVTAAFLAVMSHQLKIVIELFHLRGVAVLFDVVYNHVNKDVPGPDGVESLWNFEQFTMQADHDSYLFSDQDHNGPCWDLDWKLFCRQFLIDNALFFLREYHIDGYRYDETTKVVEKNRSYGWRWCQDLTGTVRFVKPEAVQIAEHWPWGGPDPRVVGTAWGHAGFDACYHDGLRGAIRNALRQARWGMQAQVDMQAIATYLWPPGFNEAWRCVQHIENHDIVHVKEGDRVAQLAAPGNSRSWWGRSRSRVAAALLLTAPGIPLLFMGQEFLEDKRWSDNPKWEGGLLWWQGLDSGEDRAMVNFHRFFEELVRLRRSQPALRGDRLNVFHCENGTRVLAFHRWLEGGGQDIIVVASLNDQTFSEYELPWPGAGQWREIFNSDAYDDYGATGNGGAVSAWDSGGHALPARVRLTIPANSVLVFAR